MSDAPRPSESVEQRLALVARGVQRMADAFGSLEARLAGLAESDEIKALTERVDEYRVRGRSEIGQLNERLDDLVERLARIELSGVVDRPPPPDYAPMVQAVKSLRDEMSAALADQATRLTRLHDAVATVRDDPTPARLDDLQRILDDVLSEIRSVHGEVVTASGQLRTDLAADVAAMRDALQPPVDNRLDVIGEGLAALRAEILAELAAARAHDPAVDDARLATIEQLLTSLRDELAIDRLEASMRDMAEDTSGLRADVRRSFDRVLHEISTTEESLKGEVRAIDSRLTGFGDDLRLVRGLRDGLEALSSGVDAVRQLASRGATAGQMAELAGDLSMVLAEIETARSQVLAVDQQVGRLQAHTPSDTIDVDHSAEVAREVEELERKVTDEIADLGARIEAIAERAVATSATADDAVGGRLQALATSARQLSMGIAEDLRARRKRSRKPVRER